MTNKLRTVLVGCGNMSRRWVEIANKLPEIELVGFVDLIEEHARARAADWQGDSEPVISTDLSETLAQTQPDVLFNCTLIEAHYPIVIKALAAGCHVLTEKPLADSMEHAREMVDSAAKAGKVLAVTQNRRYDENIRRLRAFLQSGAIGRITTVNSDFYIGAHAGGYHNHMQHPLLLDMAIHTFDQARLITGADAKSVLAREWNPPGSWYPDNAAAMAIFDMTDDLVYAYRGSWCAEGLNTTWECDWRIIGEKGSITWDGAEGFKAQVVKETGGFFSVCEDVPVPPVGAGTKVGAHEGVIREFVHCVQTGEQPETAGAENIKSLAMVFGVIESAAKRAAVELFN